MHILFHLLHLADSAFPVGTHAHSLGLETLVNAGTVHDAAALSLVLTSQLEVGLARTDLVALRHAYRHWQVGAREEVLWLNSELAAHKVVREWHEASLSAGRRLLATATQFLEQPRALLEPGYPLHHAVAFAVVGAELEVGEEELCAGFAYAFIAGQIAAAIRLIPLGQSAAQQALHRLKPALARAVDLSRTLSPEEMGGALPLLEIAGMQHERAYARLFIS